MVRAGVQRLYKDAEEPEEDGHLDDQWSKTPHGVDTRLPVHAHGFLGDSLPVPGVTLLDFPHAGLQIGHRLHLAELLDGERQRYQPNNDRKNDDGDAHVVEADGVEHHQEVQQGPDNYFSPEIVDTQRAPTSLPAGCGKQVDSVKRLVALRVLVVPAPHLYLAALDLHPADAAVVGADIHRFAHCHQRGPDFCVPQTLGGKKTLGSGAVGG